MGRNLATGWGPGSLCRERDKTGFDSVSEAEDMRQARAAEPAVESIGLLLKARREAMGLSAAQLAKTLRIRQVYIDALEGGRNELLPGSAYAFGFIRSYARFVGMDGERAVQQFKDEAKNIPRQVPLVLPKALTESRTPGFAALVIGAVLLAAAYGAWTLWGGRAPAPRPASVTPPPVAVTAPPVTVAPPPVLPLPVPVETPPPAGADNVASQADPEAAASFPSAPAAAPVAPPPSAAPAQPVVTGPQYTVRAVQASWVEIRGGDGKVLVSRVLAPGETASIPLDPRARMVTGNAGGVVIEAEGQVSPVLGRVGQVIRDIPLEPNARAAFFAAPRENTTAPPPPPGE